MVARGWSPGERTRIGFYVIVGLALVLNPLAVQAFDLDEPRYEYVAYDAEPTADTIRFDSESGVIFTGGVSGIDCGFRWETWDCYLQEHVVRTGNVTVDTVEYDDRPPTRYVHFPTFYSDFEGGFYRRTIRSGNESTTVSYEPVDGERVAAAVSVALSDARPPVANAVRSGSAYGETEMERGLLVRDGDRYYYVIELGERDGPPGLIVLSLLAALLGLGFLTRGHRLWLARRDAE
ncbi:hypothetical protein ACOZ4N_07865 [Halorientalis pallida]|uniref:hypothetical protein n=1 Tax=Halorientalis pallida TaxID=2479928 RepID=UPI003C6FF020